MACRPAPLATLAIAAALIAATPAGAQAPVAKPALGSAGRAATEGPLPRPAAAGYLPAANLPNAAPLLGPPPPPGSGTAEGDLDTFEETRRLQGSERWALATRDAVFGADALLQDFSCALGVQLTAADAPALQHLLSRVVVDSEEIESRAKKTFKRPRPFVDHQGEVCVETSPWLARSYSYPSGHSTYAWTAALILAEAVPDRATQILARARTYGESRVVCGVHYVSDVQAGRIAASAAFSALQAQPEFQHDLQAVRLEMARLRRTNGASPAVGAPDARECRIEEDAVAHPVW